MDPFYFIVIGVVVLVFLFMAIINRYRRCPSDKILVIYGNRGSNKSAKCVHGGGAFVWPIVEDYAYLSLTPLGIDANLTNALSRQNIRVDVPCRFTVGISTEPESMLAAAERLLGLTPAQIQELARDILFGQLRLVIATMSIEELNSDRDKFLEAITANVEVELKKIGLRLINVNVTDIKDESGYIEALGHVRETRIRTAEANAQAVQGENEAKIAIANSDADRREREAEAQRKAVAAEKVASAQALEEAYAAEQKAEIARADRDRASQQANVIVAQEIEKRRLVIAAEATAEQKRVNAKGEADAIYAKMEAEANGLFQVLTKQADGYDKMIKAAGGDATKAYTLLLLEKLPELVKTQVDAIKGINIDKVTVWDNGGGGDAKTSTANFLSGLMKSIPPLGELFDQAGLSLPEYLAKKKEEDETPEPSTPEKE